MKLSNLPKLDPTQEITLLGVDECLGTINIKDLASLICSLCNGSSSKEIKYTFKGLGKCPQMGEFFAYGLQVSSDGIIASNINKISLSTKDINGLELEVYLQEHLGNNNQFKLVNVSNPSNYVVYTATYFGTNGCENTFIINASFISLSGEDFTENTTYKLVI